MKSTPSTVDRAPLTRITINSNNSELKNYEEYENWDPVEIENRLKEILQIDKECFIEVDSEINEWEIYGAFGNKDGFCFIEEWNDKKTTCQKRNYRKEKIKNLRIKELKKLKLINN